MVVDCFIFYNELDMLRYRLSVLDEHVDRFVLVEAERTFVGRKKPLFYRENKGLFERFRNRIVHISLTDETLDEFPIFKTAWDREHYQRCRIDFGLCKLSDELVADDLILISDVDEIPDPAVIERLSGMEHDEVRAYTLLQHFYYWDVEHFVSPDCAAAKAVRFDAYVEKFGRRPQAVREDRDKITQPIERAGWHLSYFGDDAWVSNKIKNFAHQELATPENTDESVLAERRTAGADVFGMPTPALQYIPIASNPYPPPRLDLLPHQKLCE